jgi:hypothetical protein
MTTTCPLVGLTDPASPDDSLEGTPPVLTPGVPGGQPSLFSLHNPPGPAGPDPTRRDEAARTTGDRVDPQPDRADRPAQADQPGAAPVAERGGGLTP